MARVINLEGCCTPATGACCQYNSELDERFCEDLTEACCTRVGGFYLGDGTSCATDDCGCCATLCEVGGNLNLFECGITQLKITYTYARYTGCDADDDLTFIENRTDFFIMDLYGPNACIGNWESDGTFTVGGFTLHDLFNSTASCALDGDVWKRTIGFTSTIYDGLALYFEVVVTMDTETCCAVSTTSSVEISPYPFCFEDIGDMSFTIDLIELI